MRFKRERSRPEQADRKHRCSDSTFDDHENGERYRTAAHRHEHERMARTEARPLEEGEDDTSKSGDGQAGARPVDPRGSRWVAAFAHESRRQRDDDRGQRHVQEEDRAPADVLDQPAAGDGSEGRRHGAETGPRANRRAAIGVVERGADNREAPRYEEGGADALRRARHDERARGSSETAGDRRDGEQHDAGEERPLTSELIAHRAADENQTAQEQGVRLDHPLDVSDGRVQLCLERGQSNVHHGRVDERQAGADDGRHQRPLTPRRHSRSRGRQRQCACRVMHESLQPLSRCAIVLQVSYL